MAGSKGSKYYNVFLNYDLNLKDVDGAEILNCEGFDLLVTIEKLKSIVAAAAEMKISYRKAWDIINKVENKLGFHLVVKQRGGSEGGRTYLSEEGRQLINGYKELTSMFDQSTTDIAKKFFRKINN